MIGKLIDLHNHVITGNGEIDILKNLALGSLFTPNTIGFPEKALSFIAARAGVKVSPETVDKIAVIVQPAVEAITVAVEAVNKAVTEIKEAFKK